MSFESLKSTYTLWPKLSIDGKIALLHKTEEKFETATAQKVADFCLYVLSTISFEDECYQNKALEEPVNNLHVKVLSKSGSIFFNPLLKADEDYVGYLVNKKNPYLVLGKGPIKNSLAISESRTLFGKSCVYLDADISQETCKLMLALFNMSLEMQSHLLQDLSGKELKGIVKAAECFKVQGALAEEIQSQIIFYKKQREILKKIPLVKDEKMLARVFKDFIECKSFQAIRYPLFMLIEKQYLDHQDNSLSEDAEMMLKWYLLQTNSREFTSETPLKEHKPLCFAHCLLLNAAFEKNPNDLKLGIKKAYLNFLVYKKEDPCLSHFYEKMHLCDQREIEEILDTIETIFSLRPKNENLRMDLVKIIQAVPRIDRELFTEDLLIQDYYVSALDPLLLFMMEEINQTGRGEDWVHLVLTYCGVNDTIEFLKHLATIYPENILKFSKNLMLWSVESELEREEHMQLFLYALSMTPDLEYLNIVTRYMRAIILSQKMDVQTVYSALFNFFDKVTSYRGVQGFFHSLCEYALKNNAFDFGLQLIEWDKKINPVCKISPFSLDMGLLLSKNANYLQIADLYIKRYINVDILEECVNNLLIRSRSFKWSQEHSFTRTKNALINLALKLCCEKQYSKVVELNETIETVGDESILFSLLEKYSKFDVESSKKLITLLFECYSMNKIVNHFLCAKNFNLFHKLVIEILFNRLPDPTNDSMVNDDTYKNAEKATSDEVAKFLIRAHLLNVTDEETIRMMNFLLRVSGSRLPKDENLLFMEKGMFVIAERLWHDKYYDTLIEFIDFFESNQYLILLPFLAQISKTHIHDENFDRVFSLILKYGYSNFLLSYLKESKTFTPYHSKLMNKIKANSILAKQTF